MSGARGDRDRLDRLGPGSRGGDARGQLAAGPSDQDDDPLTEDGDEPGGEKRRRAVARTPHSRNDCDRATRSPRWRPG
jgi:hypothetical protein